MGGECIPSTSATNATWETFEIGLSGQLFAIQYGAGVCVISQSLGISLNAKEKEPSPDVGHLLLLLRIVFERLQRKAYCRPPKG